MVVRREASSVAAQDVGLDESQDMSKILILDHLTPRMQGTLNRSRPGLIFSSAGPKTEPFSLADQKIHVL